MPSADWYFDFISPFAYLQSERLATLSPKLSIRYRPVDFTDPEETVLLPESIESLVVFRGAGVVGHRTVQTFSGYKRFVTAGRLVK